MWWREKGGEGDFGLGGGVGFVVGVGGGVDSDFDGGGRGRGGAGWGGGRDGFATAGLVLDGDAAGHGGEGCLGCVVRLW